MEHLKKIAMVGVHKKRAFHHVDDDVLDSSFFSSSSFSFSRISSESSLESNSFEEVSSHFSSSSSSPSDEYVADPLSDMSSLSQQLPIKRGLSKHYEGKSQSFTSLANVRRLEDLAKSENPQSKKLKYCRTYEEGLLMAETQKLKCGPSALSRPISGKGTLKSSNSKKPFSSFTAKRVSANGFRPPRPPQRSTSTTTNNSKQTALFA